jgi:hypothetical protein
MPGWTGSGVVTPLLGLVVVGGTAVLVVTGLEVVDVVVGMLGAGPSTQ